MENPFSTLLISIFSNTNILDGVSCTCYPDKDLVEKLSGNFVDEDIVFDKNILTSKSPSTATHFALAICEILGYDSNQILNDLEGK